MEGTMNGTSQTGNLKCKSKHSSTVMINLKDMNISEIPQKLPGIKHLAAPQRGVQLIINTLLK